MKLPNIPTPDEIIDNSGGITELTGKIGELLEKYAGTV